MARPAAHAEHQIVYRDVHAYVAHPHAVALPDGTWLCVFNQSVRRRLILHPPQDPFFSNFLIRSADRGRSWSVPVIVPDFGWQGMECASLTALADGRVVLNQWRFRWYPLPAARKHPRRTELAFPVALLSGSELSPDLAAPPAAAEALMPWARNGGAAVAHLSDDGGVVWDRTVELDTRPFIGGYSMRGAIALADGRLMLPLCDIPAYRRVFVLFSDDRGESWGPPLAVAAGRDRTFEEPCALALPSGRILLVLRENRSRTLYQVVSDDAGQTWSAPAPTGIEGFPGHLLMLPDGRILCTYGRRTPDYGIHAVLSYDDGMSWTTDEVIAIRGGLPNRDLGYPCTLPIGDGRLYTIYYCQDEAGTTGLESTTWWPGAP